ARRLRRTRTAGGKLSLDATSKRSSTAVETLLTICQPGTEARMKRYSISISGMLIVSETRITGCPTRVGFLVDDELQELNRHKEPTPSIFRLHWHQDSGLLTLAWPSLYWHQPASTTKGSRPGAEGLQKEAIQIPSAAGAA